MNPPKHELSPTFIDALNSGEEQAFDDLFRNYYPSLCFFAERILSSQSDAEDTVEEVFLKIWQQNRQFESENHIKHFLYKSVRNACFDFLKTTRRSKERDAAFQQTQDNENQDYLREIIRAEVWGEIFREIQRLPPQYNKVITMSYLQGKKNEEIAQELGISLQVVKNYKFRGLSLLRGRLPKEKYLLLLSLAGSFLQNQ